MKIREIINSSQAPSSLQDLWLDRGSLKYFSGSGWKAINASGTPPQVVLSVEDLESAVDDTTSAAIQKAALIVIVDEEGKSTVCTRIMNDSSSNPSFFVPSSDNTLMRLTFSITSKTFSSSEYKPDITIVAATVDTLGAVKQADRVNDLSVSAELADVVTAFNSLLSKLITAGIMVQKPT